MFHLILSFFILFFSFVAFGDWRNSGEWGYSYSFFSQTSDKANLSRPHLLPQLNFSKNSEHQSVFVPDTFEFQIRAWHNFNWENSSSEDENQVDLRRFTATWMFDQSELILGLQTYIWGENINGLALDVVNPRDFSEYLFGDIKWVKIPNWMVKYQGSLFDLEYKFIFVPLAARERLPKNINDIELTPYSNPVAFQDMEGGLRIGQLTPGGWQWDLYYYHHYSRIPVIVQNPLTFHVDVIDPQKTDTFGASANVPVYDWFFRSDIAVNYKSHMTNQKDLTSPVIVSPVNAILGIDKLGPSQSYGLQYHVNSNPNESPIHWSVFFWNCDIMAEKLKIESLYFRGINNEDERIDIKLIWLPKPNLEASIHSISLTGREDSFIEFWADKDLLMTNLTYFF